MKPAIPDTLVELKKQLKAIYGDRLKGVYVFGSYARGDARPESDLDVLIVLDHVDDYSREIDRTSAVISELSLRSGVAISRVFVPEQRWETDQTNFFLNVREEAVPA